MSTTRRPARAIAVACGALTACAAPAAATVIDRDAAPGASVADALEATVSVPLAPRSPGPLFGDDAGRDGRRAHSHRRHRPFRRLRLSPRGRAIAPAGAPLRIRRLVRAANRIAHTPYVWGGGHGSWSAAGYDCSGSVGYALHGAGVLDTPVTSGALTSYGRAGEGRWVTVYANGGHVYMVVAGLRFDTSARDATGSRWTRDQRGAEGYVARHPAGL